MNTKNISISSKEKIILVSNLYTMLSSGIPILEIAESLLEDAKGNQKKLLTVLRDDLIQGQHVATSFAKFPKIFDNVTVNIIKASEEAGELEKSLKDMKDNIRKEIEFNSKIKSTMIYPVFILGLFIAVFLMILIVVVPKISAVFSNLKVVLPAPTKVMIFMSNSLLTYPIPIIIVAGAIFAGLMFFYKKNRRFFVRALVALPLISKLARQIDLTRFTRSLYLLLTAGIPITSALALTEDVVTKKEIQIAITHAKNVVSDGKKLSEGLRDSKKVIPPIMIKIIEAGERSGTLDKSMADVSEYLDYEVSESLKTITALIEPIMLVLVGVGVGAMMMTIIGPIYSLIGQIAPH